MAWEWRVNWINTHWIEEMNLEIYALRMFTSWFVKSLLTDFNIYVSSWYSAQLRHLRSIYCSLGFWGPILPIALRIGALAALAALAARSCTSYAGCASCVTCVQYIVHWAFGDPYCLQYFELELWLRWLRAAAPAALAAPAASPAFNILFIGLLMTHTAYSTSN